MQPCALPENALLGAYRAGGAYTDCYTVDVPGEVSPARYVAAFYTSAPFRLERLILKWAVDRPSTDDEAVALASGRRDDFSAWRVEERSVNQLLLCDYRGSTRSWLMVAPVVTQEGPATRLYFGSAVVPSRNAGGDKTATGWMFRVLLGFHRIYSRVLLAAAKSRLESGAV